MLLVHRLVPLGILTSLKVVAFIIQPLTGIMMGTPVNRLKDARLIGGFPKHLVTPFGEIFSIAQRNPRPVQLLTDKDGYKIAIFYKDGKKCLQKVHRIVAKAFIPNPGNKPIVHHKDSDRTNNSSDNLEWVTSSENLHLSSKLSKNWRLMQGQGNRNAILTDNQAIEIRRLYKQKGYSRQSLADTYGVSKSLVEKIYYGISWKHTLVSKD